MSVRAPPPAPHPASSVTIDRQGSVLIVTLNRPEKRNALHPDLVHELHLALDAASVDPHVHVVVLTGAGPGFCAGLDLALLPTLSQKDREKYLDLVLALFREVYTLPQPVIAAVNGAAFAGGFDLAAFCDLRVAAPNATFSQAEINLGLTQLLYPLYKSIGLGRAKELALTGAAITAEEAHRIGLVNRILPAERFLEAAVEWAQTIAAKPRAALVETKRLSRELIEADSEDAFRMMAQTLKERLASKDYEEQGARYLARLKGRA